ncbi:MAG TPA: lipid II flippase MurJ [Rhizomicrobium sp.]|nr:lipid II flippase MurJ [Rhizomicrobium sp.]
MLSFSASICQQQTRNQMNRLLPLNLLRRIDILPGAHHRSIFSGLAFVSTFIVIAKLFGALKEVAVAARYGTGSAVDAYVYIFNLLSWPLSVWISTLGIVLIPLFVRANRDQPAQLAQFEREFFSLSLAAGAVLGIIGGLAITAILISSASGLSPGTMSYARWMAIPLAVIVPMGFASTLFATQLMVSRRHTNSLFEGIPALCILIAVLLSHDQTGRSLVIGTVAGYAVQLVTLILSESGFRKAISFSLEFRSPLWAEVRKYSLIVILSQLLITASGVLDQVMVAHLNGNANAVLGYAARLLALFTGLGATAIGRALLPVLSELRAGGEGQESAIAKHWASILFFIGAVVAGLGWITAQTFVHVAFERGAFSSQDTLHVAEVLRFGFLQLPFYFSGIVIVQLVASRAQYSAFLYANAIALAGKVAFNFTFIPMMGVKGAALATALMYAVSFAALWVLSAKAERATR